jgi:manganese efflux pump family protein
MTGLGVLLPLALVIGLNNFVVALAIGALGRDVRRGRVLLMFGVFEFSIPLVGVLLGRGLARSLAEQASWVGPVLLALLGIVTLANAFRERKERVDLAGAVTSWGGLAGLSAGLSVDNLVVGFSLGIGGISPLLLATTIACTSVLFALVGLVVGQRAHRSFESAAAILTGLVLIGLSIVLWMGAG